MPTETNNAQEQRLEPYAEDPPDRVIQPDDILLST